MKTKMQKTNKFTATANLLDTFIYKSFRPASEVKYSQCDTKHQHTRINTKK